jgi:hypothetical protein
MIRTQIQLPDQLYKEVQRVAETQEWSIAEVIRRGAEAITRAYPPIKKKRANPWRLPPPIRSKVLVHDPEQLRDLIRDDTDPLIS